MATAELNIEGADGWVLDVLVAYVAAIRRVLQADRMESSLINDVGGPGAAPLRVRFKFMLGEWVFSEWRQAFLPLQQQMPTAQPGWPEIESLLPAHLPADVAGYQLRRTAVDRFPRGVSRQGGWLCYSPRQECLYFVNLAGDFEAYLQRRSPKSRQNLKRSVKRFMDSNPDGFEVFTTPQSMIEFHREAVSISKRTYQSFMLNAGLPDGAEYLRQMQDRAARGEARGYLLREQGTPVAFAWCTAKGDEITYQIIGYLSEYADKSPGTVLLYQIIQDLFALGQYRLFDFGTGSAFYKESFATDKIDFADSYLFRPGIKNSWKLWWLWKTECFSNLVGEALNRMGLKKKIRLLMRRGASRTHG